MNVQHTWQKIYRYNKDTNPSTQNRVDKKSADKMSFITKVDNDVTTKTLEVVWRLCCNVAVLTTMTTWMSIRPTNLRIRMRLKKIDVRSWSSGGNPTRFSGPWSFQPSGWSKWFCQPENKKNDEVRLINIIHSLGIRGFDFSWIRK